jgi:plastocyanin
MGKTIVGALVTVWLGISPVWAADIDGTIIVERTLTKRNVTAAAGLYQRGTAVELRSDAIGDPLAYERTHVVIYLEGLVANANAAADLPVPTMEQRDRRFVPDLLVVPAGGSVSFPNFDPIFHNVFSLSKPKSFDLGNYPKGQTRTEKFATPGIVFVYCHLHSNMTASIVVTPNRWNTLSDATGKFSLADVPPGKYTVVAWHKAVGYFRQQVEITSTRGAEIRFVIPFVDQPLSAKSTP